jgi:hypothetical protein
MNHRTWGCAIALTVVTATGGFAENQPESPPAIAPAEKSQKPIPELEAASVMWKNDQEVTLMTAAPALKDCREVILSISKVDGGPLLEKGDMIRLYWNSEGPEPVLRRTEWYKMSNDKEKRGRELLDMLIHLPQVPPIPCRSEL